MREYLRPGHPGWRRIRARSRRVAEGPGERPDPIRRRREASVGEEREHESQQKCAVRGEGSRASSPSPGEHGGDGGGSHRLIGGVSDEGKSGARLPWRSPLLRRAPVCGGGNFGVLDWAGLWFTWACDGPHATSFLFETSKQLSVFLKKILRKKVFLKKKTAFSCHASTIHHPWASAHCSIPHPRKWSKKKARKVLTAQGQCIGNVARNHGDLATR